MKELFLTLCCLAFLSCSSGPQPIAYGTDGCHYCKMTIVDNKFGAEIVTRKGKIFKFDAVECLVNYSKQNPKQDGDAYYVINYLNGEWIVAEGAAYLRSKKIPSPMGQYIASFSAREAAKDIQNENEGVIQTWNELIDNFEITKIENF